MGRSAEIDREWGIADRLVFIDGPAGLPEARITTPWAEARIALQGAHLIDFQPRGQAGLFWLSPQAVHAPGKALRGGIPICWPWFGPHPDDASQPAHGLARTATWSVSGRGSDAEGRLWLELALPPLPAPWRGLRLVARLTVGEALTVELTSHNDGPDPRRITQALHAYLLVGDGGRVAIDGLSGLEYIDKTDGGRRHRQDGPPRIDGEVDRIYLGTDGRCRIDDPVLRRRITIEGRNSHSTIVWNPGPDKAAAMADIGPDGHRGMLCIETANAADDAVVLPAGAAWTLGATYRIDTIP